MTISFGGQNGTELALECSDDTTLAAAYQSVIDTYGVTHLDFDIEGAAVNNTVANTDRGKAIKTLMTHNSGLKVSFTVSVDPNGMSAETIDVLQKLKDAGVTPDLVNVMGMDYGDGVAPNPDMHMGEYGIASGNKAQTQLKTLFSLDDAAAYRMLGLTSMIGQNDEPSERFYLADADKVVAWAQQKHIGMLSMWSAARDKACPGGPGGPKDATCSSLSQNQWDFAKKLNAFAG